MTNKQRGGQRSGSYPRMGATPGDGISAPSATQVLAQMAAQLEAFSHEVRELKGLIREITGRPSAARGAGWNTTENLEVAEFRRARMRRTILITAAVTVPIVFLAFWGMWTAVAPKAAPTRQIRPPPTHHPDRALTPAPPPVAKVPPPPLAQTKSPPPDPVPAAPAPPRPKRPRFVPESTPEQRQPREPEAQLPPPRSRSAFRTSAQELSGGAPILD